MPEGDENEEYVVYKPSAIVPTRLQRVLYTRQTPSLPHALTLAIDLDEDSIDTSSLRNGGQYDSDFDYDEESVDMEGEGEDQAAPSADGAPTSAEQHRSGEATSTVVPAAQDLSLIHI